MFLKYYKGTFEIKINGKYLNHIHNNFIKKSIYTTINKATLQKYIDSHRENLKYQIIDSFFIVNKEGLIKNNNHLLNIHVINKNALIKKENQIIKKYNKNHNNKHKRNKKNIKIKNILKLSLILINIMVGKNILKYQQLLILLEFL